MFAHMDRTKTEYIWAIFVPFRAAIEFCLIRKLWWTENRSLKVWILSNSLKKYAENDQIELVFAIVGGSLCPQNKGGNRNFPPNCRLSYFLALLVINIATVEIVDDTKNLTSFMPFDSFSWKSDAIMVCLFCQMSLECCFSLIWHKSVFI